MPRACKRCAGGMMHWLLLPNRRGNQRDGLCAFLGPYLLASCNTLATSAERAVVRQIGVFTAPLRRFPHSHPSHCCC